MKKLLTLVALAAFSLAEARQIPTKARTTGTTLYPHIGGGPANPQQLLGPGGTQQRRVGPGGTQQLFGPGGQQIKCPAGQVVYVGSNGYVSCIKKGSLGAQSAKTVKASRLVGPGGKQIKCNSNQYVYVGANGAVSCIKKGLLG